MRENTGIPLHPTTPPDGAHKSPNNMSLSREGSRLQSTKIPPEEEAGHKRAHVIWRNNASCLDGLLNFVLFVLKIRNSTMFVIWPVCFKPAGYFAGSTVRRRWFFSVFFVCSNRSHGVRSLHVAWLWRPVRSSGRSRWAWA